MCGPGLITRHSLSLTIPESSVGSGVRGARGCRTWPGVKAVTDRSGFPSQGLGHRDALGREERNLETPRLYPGSFPATIPTSTQDAHSQRPQPLWALGAAWVAGRGFCRVPVSGQQKALRERRRVPPLEQCGEGTQNTRMVGQVPKPLWASVFLCENG